MASVLRRTFATLGVLLCGCRPGLPPEPAGHDAADDSVQTPKYQPRANPYETSAFEGVNLDGAGGHEGMNHGGMNHGGMNHGGMNHGDMNHGGKPEDERTATDHPPDKHEPADKHDSHDTSTATPKAAERTQVQP